MNSPFLQEFLKAQGTLPGLRTKTPTTAPVKSKPPATKSDPIDIPQDIKSFAREKPKHKQVEEFFRKRVKELEDD